MKTPRLLIAVHEVDAEEYHSGNSRWNIIFDGRIVGRVLSTEKGTMAYYEPFTNVLIKNEDFAYLTNPIPGFISAVRAFIKSDAFTKRQKKKARQIEDYYNKEIKRIRREKQREQNRFIPNDYGLSKVFIESPTDTEVYLTISKKDFEKCCLTCWDGYVILKDANVEKVKDLGIKKGNKIIFVKERATSSKDPWRKKILRVSNIRFEDFGIVIGVHTIVL